MKNFITNNKDAEITNLAYRILGKVGADLVVQEFSKTTDDDFFIVRLDNLNSKEIEAIVLQVLKSNNIPDQPKIDIQIPRNLAKGTKLPESCVVDKTPAAIRNSHQDKVPLLTATTHNEQADTMQNISSISSSTLKTEEHIDKWIMACKVEGNMKYVSEDETYLKHFLIALLDTISDLTLLDFANFCASVCYYNSDDSGLKLSDALGESLPFIRLPRDKDAFLSLFKTDNKKSKNKVTSSALKKSIKKIYHERSSFYFKQDAKGGSLDQDWLKENFENIDKTSLDETKLAIFKAYIDATNTNEIPAGKALFELDWYDDKVYQLFETSKNKISKKLGRQTIEYFEKEFDKDSINALSKDEIDLVSKVDYVQTRAKYQDELKTFFERHRYDMSQDRALCSKWERLVYPNYIETYDFLEALLLFCSHADMKQGAKIVIKVNGTKKHWLNEFNYKVGCYFSTMYRSVETLLQDCDIKWEYGFKTGDKNPLLYFKEFIEEESKSSSKGGHSGFKFSTSEAKTNISITFNLMVLSDTGDELYRYRIIWKYDKNSIGLSLRGDLERLYKLNHLTYSEVARIPVNKKGSLQGLSLEDVSTMQSIGSGNQAGSFVPSTRNRDLSAEITACLNRIEIPENLREQLKEKLRIFEKDYRKAIEDFVYSGLNYKSASLQAASFADLLNTVAKVQRESYIIELYKLLLKVGVVGVKGEQAAIVTPWHPERMKALALQQKQISNYCKRFIKQKDTLIDSELFEATIKDGLNNYLSPELLLAFDADDTSNTKPEVDAILTSTMTVNGYSLLEKPSANGSTSTFYEIKSNEAAKQIIEFIYSYLNLYPHIKNNLNVLLYECEIPDLPYYLIKILSDDERAANITFNLHIANSELNKATTIYQQLMSSVDADYQAQVNNSRSTSFLSNLRISVGTTNAIVKKELQRNKQFDICILYDVISRQSSLKWESLPEIQQASFDEGQDAAQEEWLHEPSLVSYRYLDPDRDVSSAVFLCCPVQQSTGRDYVAAIRTVLDVLTPENTVAYPVKQISLSSSSINNIINVTHNISDWVVSYDDLLEKRQLENNGISVVRHKRDKINGRNLVISSKSDLTVLNSILNTLLSIVDVRADDQQQKERIQILRQDSLDLSGNVILRAAKTSMFAQEMLGLVLSKKLLQDSFAEGINGLKPRAVAFFMLDDYASWFPTSSNRLADIMALGIYNQDGRIKLSIKIAEAKYVQQSDLSVHKVKSLEQTKASVSSFEGAFLDKIVPIDRTQWLARLADLLSDSRIADVDIEDNEKADAECSNKITADELWQIKMAIQEGNFDLTLSGISFVAVYDDKSGNLQCTEPSIRPDVPIYQVICPQPVLKQMFETYFNKGSVLQYLNNELSNANQPNVLLNNQSFIPIRVIDSLSYESLPESDSKPAEVINSVQEQVEKKMIVDPEIESVKATAKMEPLVHEQVQAESLEQHWRSHLRKLINAYTEAPEDQQTRNKLALERAHALQAALNSYQMNAAIIVPPHPTPNGIAVTFKGDDSLTVNKIRAKEGELLTTHGLQIANISPEPGAITINIAWPEGSGKRQIVRLLHLWSERKFNCDKTGLNTSFLLGLRENDGKLMYLNYFSSFEGLEAHDPHSLVAGGTNSGKSTFLNSFILDIAATNNSRQVKLLLIDPKQVEFLPFNSLPHLLKPTIVEPSESIAELSALVDEMGKRYSMFKDLGGVKDIKDYNQRVAPEKRLPLIFAFHDEFNLWMNDRDYRDNITAIVNKLSVAARAAGIYLTFASQRPDNTVFPMQLRDNISNRLVLKVSTAAASKIALDAEGAERLLGKGQMLARLNSKQHLIQTPFVSSDEFEAIVQAIIADDNE